MKRSQSEGDHVIGPGTPSISHSITSLATPLLVLYLALGHFVRLEATHIISSPFLKVNYFPFCRLEDTKNMTRVIAISSRSADQIAHHPALSFSQRNPSTSKLSHIKTSNLFQHLLKTHNPSVSLTRSPAPAFFTSKIQIQSPKIKAQNPEKRRISISKHIW